MPLPRRETALGDDPAAAAFVAGDGEERLDHVFSKLGMKARAQVAAEAVRRRSPTA